ncbi:kinase-like domain-containing protein [Gigaspora rosea]|uniref:Kinase-like domain-containing protein n=1 Tax=Gigaspora rosea TaxID=44941 RepID=A0A397V227_9GLOM|nr:kinase-like domain-containing protein [Gigaspora rosea]
MLVFDEFGLKRDINNGKCTNCNRYNTSRVWCQTCDPQKTTQGWTSGNKDVDGCIKEFQLKATKYEDVIEWIPFNRLDSIQKIGDRFSAIWLDGTRAACVHEYGYKYEYTRSRTLSPKVELKLLDDSQNSLCLLNRFKDFMQSKNSKVKVFGLTQNTATNDYMLVYDEFYSQLGLSDGICGNCNLNNTSPAWCQTCDPLKNTKGWTSGNKDIDVYIKELQLKVTKYEDVIEWIPFNRLDNVQKIGEGGFSSVFSATWLDGKRIVTGGLLTKYTQSRTPSCIVALKTLSGLQKNFLKEFKSYTEFRLMGSNLEVYGLTQNTANNEYLMVFQYANKGSLHKFISSNFRELNWKSKLKQLVDISENLMKVHKAKYFHGDFHSGNILLNQSINGDLISYISDLGLSRNKDDPNDMEGSIYGVLPYVAPEVLNKQPYTSEADIYSFGIIMAEMSTGKPPHYDVEYDEILFIRICNGLRPEFAESTPECYIKLARQCMDADPSNRPSASYIYSELSKWYKIVECSATNDNIELAILKAFRLADTIIPTSPIFTELQIFPKDKLTSKLLNFRNLSEPINSVSAELLKVYGSNKCDFSIFDD